MSCLNTKSFSFVNVQLYFEKVTELTARSESAIFKQALVSLATDSGLHPLVPYFIQFIADEVVSRILILSISSHYL